MKNLLRLSTFIFISLLTIGCSTEEKEDSSQDYTLRLSQVCHTADLIAGQHIDAGDFTIGENANNDVVIRYEAMDGWQLDYIHLYFGDCDDIPTTGSGNPKIGKFPVKIAMENGSTVFEYIIEFDGETPFCGCIAAHAEVSKDGQKETAWASGKNFSGRSWATFIEYCGCPSGPN